MLSMVLVVGAGPKDGYWVGSGGFHVKAVQRGCSSTELDMQALGRGTRCQMNDSNSCTTSLSGVRVSLLAEIICHGRWPVVSCRLQTINLMVARLCFNSDGKYHATTMVHRPVSLGSRGNHQLAVQQLLVPRTATQ